MNELLEYFTKIIKRELNLDITLDNINKEENLQREQPQHKSEIQSTSTTQQLPAETPVEERYKEKTDDFQMIPENIREFITHQIQIEISNLRNELLQTINSLMEKINKLERTLEELSRRPMQVVHETPQENILPSYGELKADNLDLLLHEAKELIKDQATSLIRLIRLEAVEWQLIKAASKQNEKDKIPPNLLKTLRLEINRLRKLLL